MKTKGYSSTDSTTWPRDEVYPRLTQSYLEQYHNGRRDSSPDHTAAIHDWQFNKYQQEMQQIKSKAKGYHGVRFSANYLQSPSTTGGAAENSTNTNGLLGAYLSQDSRFCKGDSRKAPSTPHPNKTGNFNW